MNGRIIFASVLILLGIGFLLDSFNFMPFSVSVSMWWPLIIVAFGIAHISKKNPPIFSGLLIIGIGLILQAEKLNIISQGFWAAFLPLLLVIFGISILLPGRRCFTKHVHHETSGEMNINSFFSGQNKRIDDKNFTGGNISAMFGGAEIDLMNCELSENGAVLNINAAFGGIEVSIPNTWKVKISGLPIFGGFEDKTVQVESNETSKILYINYNAIFGGIELNNNPKHRMRH
jgi:predicted membrane protein